MTLVGRCCLCHGNRPPEGSISRQLGVVGADHVPSGTAAPYTRLPHMLINTSPDSQTVVIQYTSQQSRYSNQCVSVWPHYAMAANHAADYLVTDQAAGYVAADAVAVESHLGIQHPEAVSLMSNILGHGLIIGPPTQIHHGIHVRWNTAQLTINGVAVGDVFPLNVDDTEAGIIQGITNFGGMGRLPVSRDSVLLNTVWYQHQISIPCQVPIHPLDVVGMDVSVTTSPEDHDTLFHANSPAELWYPNSVFEVTCASRHPLYLTRAFGDNTISWAVDGNKHVKFRPSRHAIELIFSGAGFRPIPGSDTFVMVPQPGFSVTEGPGGVTATMTDLVLPKYTFSVNWSYERPFLRVKSTGFGQSFIYTPQGGTYPSQDSWLQQVLGYGSPLTGSLNRLEPGPFTFSDDGVVFKPVAEFPPGGELGFPRTFFSDAQASIRGVPHTIVVKRIKKP